MVSSGPDAADYRLIADPTRSRILALILAAPERRALVGELAKTLSLTQPTVSHHVKALLADGIVERHPEGRRVWYSVAPEHDGWITELLAETSPTLNDAALARIVADLTARFDGAFEPERIKAVVRESWADLAERDGGGQNLVSLAARFATERLEALAASDQSHAGPPEVLFVCVHNSGRSQMASAILRQLAGDRVVVRTAGSQPVAGVNGSVVAVLDEIGVPLAGEYPKPLTDEVVRAADVVITMGCGDVCPIYPGKQYLDWDLADPAGLSLAGVRDVRDDIDRRVRDLVASLPLS